MAFFNVEPSYRFRFLDGSNSRMYNLSADPFLPAYQIGTDVIADFCGLAGQTVTITNDAAVPFPDGLFPVPHPVTNRMAHLSCVLVAVTLFFGWGLRAEGASSWTSCFNWSSTIR